MSGAVLTVDCDADIGFFPDIYNEDWLFFFDDASQGRLANSFREATQLSYYPFADARRAAWQEFGDIIAEGLYALLHVGLSVGQATREYWACFLEARRNFFEAIITRSSNAHPGTRTEMLLSVQLALKCLLTIEPDLCDRYVRLWRQDLAGWRQRVTGIQKMPSIEAALQEMRLASPSSIGSALPRRNETTPNVMAGPVVIPSFDTLEKLFERASAGGLPAGVSTKSVYQWAGGLAGGRHRGAGVQGAGRGGVSAERAAAGPAAGRAGCGSGGVWMGRARLG